MHFKAFLTGTQRLQYVESMMRKLVMVKVRRAI